MNQFIVNLDDLELKKLHTLGAEKPRFLTIRTFHTFSCITTLGTTKVAIFLLHDNVLFFARSTISRFLWNSLVLKFANENMNPSMCPITSREAVLAYHSMCFVKVFLPSPTCWKAPIFNASYIPHLFAVLNGMSHKSCNNSTTGWRATFRSLDDFPVLVKQCRFKVYLDNLEFSFK